MVPHLLMGLPELVIQMIPILAVTDALHALVQLVLAIFQRGAMLSALAVIPSAWTWADARERNGDGRTLVGLRMARC